jgi:hypothetical protein
LTGEEQKLIYYGHWIYVVESDEGKWKKWRLQGSEEIL